MTTGTTGQRITLTQTGEYPGKVYFWDYQTWSGTDRPQNLMFPQSEKKIRFRTYTETVRVEGHNVVRQVSVPLVYHAQRTQADIADMLTWQANHPYSKDWDYQVMGDLELVYYIKSGPYAGLYDHRWKGTIASGGGLPGAPSSPWNSSEDSKILEKLQERVQGSDFNMASFLGAEGHDTVKFIADTATKLYRAMLQIKRGKVHESLSILRQASFGKSTLRRHPYRLDAEKRAEQLDVYKSLVQNLTLNPHRKGDKTPPWYAVMASQWLEFHLAAAPLMGDVTAAAEQLAHRLEVPQKKAYSAKREKQSAILAANTLSGLVWATNTWQYRKKIKFVVSEPTSVPRLLGLYNPEIVLWNALPLSFVADWIYPIGQWLENRALSQALIGEFVTSTKSMLTANGLSWKVGASDFYSVVAVHGLAYRRQGSLTRTISYTLPVPLPRFTPLGALKSWQRATTAVALVVGIGSRTSEVRHLR